MAANERRRKQKEDGFREILLLLAPPLFDHLPRHSRYTYACANNAPSGLHTLYGVFGVSSYKAEWENGATSWSVKSKGWGGWWGGFDIVIEMWF